MKIRNILIAGVALTGMITTSCSDYLDVDSPSVFTSDYVYSNAYDMNMALNGLYGKLMSPFSSYLVKDLVLNSDIDFKTFSSDTKATNNPARFDVTDESDLANKMWKACYDGIEQCNLFIKGVEDSDLYAEKNEEVLQMLGEAYCIRAILYHEMVWYYGDLPYSRESANYVDMKYPVTDRRKILDDMIADLEAVAPTMRPTAKLADGVERIGQEFAHAYIARMALTAGGYSLMPDKTNTKNYGTMERPSNYLDYYKKAEEYAKKVIDAGTHSLNKSFMQVFVDECNYVVNNNDDPIFEIPFGKENTGNIGYIHGLKFNTNNSQTDYAWGGTDASARVSNMAPYLFDREDTRAKYMFCANWSYDYAGVPTYDANAYVVPNNKWSKLWSKSPLGNTSAGNTGINYPYMRYADVLLMYAEAANEVHNGPTAEAIDAVRQVRTRAFRGAEDAATKIGEPLTTATDKASFLKVVLNERKYEFAGENMRWRDLVRNNIYGQELYYTFHRHAAIADNRLAAPTYSEELAIHDGLPAEFWDNNIMLTAYYRTLPVNVSDPYFPNEQLQYLELYRPWENLRVDQVDKTVYTQQSDLYSKHRTDDGTVSAEVCYSLLGYIYRDRTSEVDYIMNNGEKVAISATPAVFPAVRYILPYPRAAIRDGAGAYVNYYGYGN